jgi:hypothetical protein
MRIAARCSTLAGTGIGNTPRRQTPPAEHAVIEHPQKPHAPTAAWSGEIKRDRLGELAGPCVESARLAAPHRGEQFSQRRKCSCPVHRHWSCVNVMS